MNTHPTLHDQLPAISAHGLVKTFGDQRAVDGIDLEVRRGEVFGVLGPNGAGKTTMLKMLATLLPIDGGDAPDLRPRRTPRAARHPPAARRHRPVRLGRRELLTATENLCSSAGSRGSSRAESRAAAGPAARAVRPHRGGEQADQRFSGGMRRRLDLAASLITRPPLIFLDEPTTGLDPRTRGQMWDTIRELVRDGCTVLLTTQYLDEADQLADRIAVIDRGVKVAQGTPDELKSSVGRCTLHAPPRRPRRPRAGPPTSRAGIVGEDAGPVARSPDASPSPLDRSDQAVDVLVALRERGHRHRVASPSQKPSLDEVFLALTGHGADDRARRQPSTTTQPELEAAR